MTGTIVLIFIIIVETQTQGDSFAQDHTADNLWEKPLNYLTSLFPFSYVRLLLIAWLGS